MIKIIGHIFFIALFLLMAFFGIGPVLFADGVMSERLLTLAIVLVFYGIWILLYRYFIRKTR